MLLRRHAKRNVTKAKDLDTSKTNQEPKQEKKQAPKKQAPKKQAAKKAGE